MSEIPTQPERVAVLNIIALDAAMRTGIVPVAAALNRPMPWRSDIESIETILSGELDVEQLIQTKPDLILHGAFDGQLFGGIDPTVLERVAPVVAYDFSSDNEWPEYFLFFTDALNRRDQGAQVLAAYEQRVSTLRDRLGADPPRVALLRVRLDALQNYTEGGFVARIFDDLGLPTWEVEEREFSLERVGDIDADVIYLFGSEDDADALQAEIDRIIASPLWQMHPAVTAGNVHVVPSYWFGFGPTEAELVLDDLERTLPTTGASAEPFPVSITHKFGEIEIPAEPQRVVTVGFSEQDPVLALGVKPVAVREWFGEQPFAVWPWAQDELGDAEPEVLVMPFGELDFEAIAALEPDLIVATHAGITAEEYATLARIAPTLAQSDEYPDFGMPWQEQTRSIGRALGREERAEQLIAGVEGQIDAARAQHPELDGATVAWISPAEGQGQYWVVGPNTPPMRFLSALGLTVSDELAEVIGEQDSAQISGEQMRLLDVDVLIVQAGSADARAAIEADPLYQQLDVAREGRAIFFERLDDPIYGALSFSTVLSLPYAVEQLAPRLAEAIGG